MRGVRGANKQPGEIRRSQNWIGGTRPGNAVFVPAPPEELTSLLADLEKYLHTKNDLPPLVRIGLAHVQFETSTPTWTGTAVSVGCSSRHCSSTGSCCRRLSCISVSSLSVTGRSTTACLVKCERAATGRPGLAFSLKVLGRSRTRLSLPRERYLRRHQDRQRLFGRAGRLRHGRTTNEPVADPPCRHRFRL